MKTDDVPTDEHFTLVMQDPDNKIFLRWSQREAKVRLDDTSLSWTSEGLQRSWYLADVLEIRLETGMMPQQGSMWWITITYRDWRRVRFFSITAASTCDPEQERRYNRFVVRLHQRIAALPQARPKLVTGPKSRHALIAAMVLAVGVFVVLPVVLMLIIRKLEALWVTLGSLLFVWPFIKAFERNRAGVYQLGRLPREMLP